MARAQNKLELIDFANREYTGLLNYITAFIENGFTNDAVFPNRLPKDMVFHLHDWHMLF